MAKSKGMAYVLATLGLLSTAMFLEGRTEVNQMREQVVQILDTSRDGKLSEDELKRFYDETKISPYRGVTINNATRSELEKFLSNYEFKPVRKE